MGGEGEGEVKPPQPILDKNSPTGLGLLLVLKSPFIIVLKQQF